MLYLLDLLLLVMILSAPGCSMVVFIHRKVNLDLFEWITWSVLFSMAFWGVLFELLGRSSLSWTSMSMLIGYLFAFQLVGYFLRHGRAMFPARKNAWWKIGLILLVGLSRFLPVFYCEVAPGADMSMHSGITRLICLADGEPENMRPLLPVDVFAGYPAGFHAMAALVSQGLDLPAYDSTFMMSCFVHGLVFFAFLVFFKTQLSNEGALLSAWLVSFVANNPQDYLGWGGNPTVLSLLLCVGAAACIEHMIKDHETFWILPCGLLVAGAMLVHPIPPMCMAFVWPVWLFFRIAPLCRIDPREWIRWIGRGSGILVVALLLCLPMLLKERAHVSQWELDWVRDWQRTGGGAWHGTLLNSPITVTRFVGKVLGWGVFLLAPPGFLLSLKRDRWRAVATLFTCMSVFGVVVNSHYWWLPLSYALYPERVVVLLLLPLGVMAGCFLEVIMDKKRIRGCVLGLLVGYGIYQYAHRYLLDSYLRVSVTKEDLEGMMWLKERTTPWDLVANDYGDAGLWIPAIIGRPIRTPHVNPFVMEEARQGLLGQRPSFLFLGSKQVYPSLSEELVHHLKNNDYRPIFCRDGVMILRNEIGKDSVNPIQR